MKTALQILQNKYRDALVISDKDIVFLSSWLDGKSRKVLEMVAEGMTVPEIGRQLGHKWRRATEDAISRAFSEAFRINNQSRSIIGSTASGRAKFIGIPELLRDHCNLVAEIIQLEKEIEGRRAKLSLCEQMLREAKIRLQRE